MKRKGLHFKALKRRSEIFYELFLYRHFVEHFQNSFCFNFFFLYFVFDDYFFMFLETKAK